MNEFVLPEYIEELQVNDAAPQYYLPVALQATKNLGWLVVATFNTTLMCRTQGTDTSPGEDVAITVSNGRVVFTSRHMNGYYAHTDQGQNKANCEQYKASYAAIEQQNKELERRTNPQMSEKYGALVPSRTYLVTPLLIYINVAIFALMVLSGISPVSPTAQSLFAWGGNLRMAVLNGEWWRLFTHMFLHGGIAHLAGNIFALAYVGMMLEPLLGKFRFAAAYILTGICGGLMSLYFHPNSVGVGASGAIFGMYGVFLAMLTTKHIPKTARKTMLRSILFFVVYNLMMGLQGNTDNAAHVGGLLSGFIIGFVYYPGVDARHGIKRQLIATAAILASVIGIIMVSLFIMANHT